MKITICGSLSFSKEMINIQKKLNVLGHEVILPYTTGRLLNGELEMKDIHEMKENLDMIIDYAKNVDAIKKHNNEIKNSDAILVLNLEKKGIKNYIGANTFLEMGFAYVLDKKIFLFNEIPEMEYHKEEIGVMEPIVLNGDLSKIQ